MASAPGGGGGGGGTAACGEADTDATAVAAERAPGHEDDSVDGSRAKHVPLADQKDREPFQHELFDTVRGPPEGAFKRLEIRPGGTEQGYNPSGLAT